MRGRTAWLLCAGMLLVAAGGAQAGPLDEAAELKNEAVKILQSGSSLSTDPKLYAQAVVKLERAMRIVEGARAEDTTLAQEINSALFWAKKFSTNAAIDEVVRQRGGAGDGGTSAPSPKTATKSDESPEGDPLGGVSLAEARKKFQAAEKFAKGNSDDYAVALRWFQTAELLSGTDYAVKALNLARAAQQRHAARQKKATPGEDLPDTPEMRLVREADQLAAGGNYEGAFAIYQASLKKNETPIAHRKLAHAYFDRGQQMKDELMPQFEKVQAEYANAFREATRTVYTGRGGGTRRTDWSYPPLVAAKRKADALNAKGREAVGYYDQAYVEFGKVLGLAPQQKDFDAAGHQGLCYSVRGDVSCRIRARQLLGGFMDNYSPGDDVERTLYEFCRSEMVRITPKLPGL